MKKNLLHYFVLSWLLAMVGCSGKNNSVTIDVSSVFSLEGFDGGLIVSGEGPNGQSFIKSVFSGSSVNVVLPDGSWKINAVGWDGGTPFAGTPACGQSTFNLTSTSLNILMKISEANCLSENFSGEAFITPAPIQTLHPLRIVTCGSFYSHSASEVTKITTSNSTTIPSNFCSGLHPLDMRSGARSLKIIPLNKNIDGPVSSGTDGFCLDESEMKPGIFNTNLQLPIKGLPLKVALYKRNGCQQGIGEVSFLNGLQAGDPAKFDSLFDHHVEESDVLPAANRLFLPTYGLFRGWSPLYHLMPEFKCEGGVHCTALETSPVYDYFFEIDYGASASNEHTFTFPGVDCEDIDVRGELVKTCNPDNQEEISVRPTTNCSDDLNDICRSPRKEFTLIVNRATKHIYFNGRKSYASEYRPIDYSPFWTPFEALFDKTLTNSPVSSVNENIQTFNMNLQDSLSLVVVSPQSPYLSEDESSFDPISTDDGLSISLQTPVMLPPNARDQKEVLTMIHETMGGTGMTSTFMYNWNNGNWEDEQRDEFGKITKIREFFSPRGPSLLFRDKDSCSELASQGVPEVRSISFADKTYVVTISPGTDSYEKKMTLEKDNVTESVMLFNCSSSSGRLESVDEGTWNLDSYRSKEIITWTEDNFEFYSWQAQAELENGDSTFEDGVKNEETLSYGAIYKKGPKSVEGRIMDYKWDRDAMDPYRIRSVRFSRDLDPHAETPFAFSYYFLNDSRLDNLFTTETLTIEDSLDRAFSYQTFKEDKFDSPQFCSTQYIFPFSFIDTSCPMTFLAQNVVDLFAPAITLLDYQKIRPEIFKDEFAHMGEIPVDWDQSDFQSPTLGVGTKTGSGTYLIQETVTINAYPGDLAGVDHVELFFDGQNIEILTEGQLEDDGRYSYSFNSTGRTNGVHEVRAIFYDDQDSPLAETRMSVYILNPDTTPPNASFNFEQSGENLILTATASDVGGSGIAQVVFKNGTTPIGTVTSAPYTLTLPLSTFNPGNNVLSILVIDKAGNEQTSGTTNFQGPETSVENLVSLTATINPNIANFSIQYLGVTPAYAQITCTKADVAPVRNFIISQGDSSYQWSWNAADAGTYTCTVSTYGNGSVLAVSSPITFTLTVDSTPPVIVATPETASVSFTPGMTLVATVTDNVEVRSVNFSYFKSGNQPINIYPVAKAGDNYTASLPADLEAGIDYTLIITADDSSSNITTQSIPFIITAPN